MPETNSAYLVEIHQLLTRYYNQEELRSLCFQLGICYDDLPATGRAGKARELVTYLDRRKRLPELKEIVSAQRPHAPWPSYAAKPKENPPAPPLAERWQLNKADFTRLANILQAEPRFATPQQRLDLLNEAFSDSPRREDIKGGINVDGAPRSVAIRLINHLVQFGQDIKDRETLGLLILTLLAGLGDNPDAHFLRGLLSRYPLGVQVKTPPEPDKRFLKQDPLDVQVKTLPEPGKRFLKQEDRKWLVQTIGNLARFQDLPGRRNLLIDAQIPDAWIGEISLERGGTSEIARTVVNDLERRGSLPQNPQTHALGGLLEALSDSLGVEQSRRAVALLFRYRLNSDHERLNEFSQLYGVPLPLFAEEIDRPQLAIPGSLPAAWQRDVTGQLEALYANGKKNWVDIDFLVAGARAAQSVCRLEWQGQGVGTGFLVAPDLILTNYHVIMPQNYTGALETRLRTCQIRFGATAVPGGGVSAGVKVSKLHQDSVVAFSEIDNLDFALLRLKEPVEDKIRISRAVLSKEAIYLEQYANIIQHPLGGAMKVTLRSNQIVKLLPHRIYYLSDTQQGSSGAPVFDDDWQVIALHRAAGLQDATGKVVLEANEGVPILDIVREIEQFLGGN
ncbi:MAG: hypothetical protein CSA11_07615 [Chloroflexi bacterium]|nr:MAG: hypothetical protein CSA11_07615 [Chloroflexota bacterium]